MNKKEDLNEIRKDISDIDQKIVELLAQRRDVCLDIVNSKDQNKLELRDTTREKAVLVEAMKLSKNLGLDTHYVHSVFNEIIADSNRVQRKFLQSKINEDNQDARSIKVCFPQVMTKYALEAANRNFSDCQINYETSETFKDVFEKVESGKFDYGLIAIENTTAGANNEVYDLLLHTQLKIVGEVKVKVEPCLLALDNTNFKAIRVVYCHPQDALLCKNFLKENNLKIKYLADYEHAVEKVVEVGHNEVAAITGKLVEDTANLKILKENIGNQKEIYSRFIIVARKPIEVDLRIPAKTSIVFSTNQEPGSLATALNVFKEYEINLTKLESRPVPGNHWEEMFYADFIGNIADERVKEVLDQVSRKGKFVKVLGCYSVPDVEAVKLNPAMLRDPEDQAQPSDSKAEKKEVKKENKSSLISSRDYKEEDTVIDIKGVKVGGKGFVVMSGPCSVESYDQIMDCARHAHQSGSLILRGGCFKPRTSPYSFQGLGYEGLDMLVEAGKKYGMPVVTEVLSTEDVMKVAEKTDIIQVGARNMQNFTLLSEIGRTQRPVLLKRGMSSTISDLLNAAEYILAQGNLQVMFCERGIRTFETATRFTLDLSAVPVLKRKSHLPVIIDPSHAAGERHLVPSMAIAAKAIGAHGIIVEFHPEPEKAKSDGPQALRFPQLEKLMRDLDTTPWGDY